MVCLLGFNIFVMLVCLKLSVDVSQDANYGGTWMLISSGINDSSDSSPWTFVVCLTIIFYKLLFILNGRAV